MRRGPNCGIISLHLMRCRSYLEVIKTYPRQIEEEEQTTRQTLKKKKKFFFVPEIFVVVGFFSGGFTREKKKGNGGEKDVSDDSVALKLTLTASSSLSVLCASSYSVLRLVPL